MNISSAVGGKLRAPKWRWSYKLVAQSAWLDSLEELYKLGQDGWELCAVVDQGYGQTGVFKKWEFGLEDG